MSVVSYGCLYVFSVSLCSSVVALCRCIVSKEHLATLSHVHLWNGCPRDLMAGPDTGREPLLPGITPEMVIVDT